MVLVLLVARRGMGRAWMILMGIHIVLFLMAIGIFWYASWRLWPRRIFALIEELPEIRRRFTAVGVALILIAGMSMALGLLAKLLR